jgi:hypothetical protein
MLVVVKLLASRVCLCTAEELFLKPNLVIIKINISKKFKDLNCRENVFSS